MFLVFITGFFVQIVFPDSTISRSFLGFPEQHEIAYLCHSGHFVSSVIQITVVVFPDRF